VTAEGVAIGVVSTSEESGRWGGVRGDGGWGFADFTDSKPGSEALHKTYFPCHAPAKDRDFVFTRYAP
jgi:Cytochrome P460